MAMVSNKALVSEIRRIFNQNGSIALEEARKQFLITHKDDSLISKSFRYFSNVTLNKAMPVFPALLAISCKSVGGDPTTALPFGKAIIYISGAADLHDDVIDKSPSKCSKLTVAGKFGETVAILAGDILLVEGLTLLHDECDKLSKEKSKLIMHLVSNAVLEISIAETLEMQLKGRLDLSPEQFYEIIRLKAVVPELAMKIGAILGGANSELVNKLGQFGRIYGIISIVSDECADIFELSELTSRLKNESAPIPLIYSLRDHEKKDVILSILHSDFSDRIIHEKLAEAVFSSSEVQLFLKSLVTSSKGQIEDLKNSIKEEAWSDLQVLLAAPLKFFSK
jgi:geranylgeranyl pyrophosphate synthase